MYGLDVQKHIALVDTGSNANELDRLSHCTFINGLKTEKPKREFCNEPLVGFAVTLSDRPGHQRCNTATATNNAGR